MYFLLIISPIHDYNRICDTHISLYTQACFFPHKMTLTLAHSTHPSFDKEKSVIKNCFVRSINDWFPVLLLLRHV